MLDWTTIAGFQEKQEIVTVPFKLQSALVQKLTAMGLTPSEQGFMFRSDDLSWTDRMVDRFTGYIDIKIAELQAWITHGLTELGQGTLMFVLAGGQLFCYVYGISIVARMMLNLKQDDDYITKGILAAGGYVVLRSVEATVFGV